MTIEKETLPAVGAGFCCIIPPYVIDHLAQSSDAKIRQLAIDTIGISSADARGTRNLGDDAGYGCYTISRCQASPACL